MRHYAIGSQELFNDLREGNTEAYEFIFKTYYPRLRNYASSFIADPDDLSDILQDCFVRLWERRGTLTFVSLPALLFTMVRNTCLNFLRHKTVMNQCPIDSLPQVAGEEALYNYIFLDNPEEEFLYDELRRQINGLIDSLPPRSRQVFIMSRIEGKKNREIADELKISVKGVEHHISKALSVFHKFFGEHGNDPVVLLLVYSSLLSAQ